MRSVARKASGIRLIPAIPLLVLVALVAVAIFAPLIAPHPPTEGSLSKRNLGPAWTEGGSSEHLLGTDRFGRDILSRIVYGARVSLMVSLVAILFSATIGTALGLLSAYYGGRIDAVIMRVTDVVMSMPLILMAIILVAIVGASFANVVLVIALLLWPRYARQVRGEGLAIREQDFVAFARVAGTSAWRIMALHLLPNVIPSLTVLVTFQVGYVILLESSLSFLGVGIPPPQPAWGAMVAEGRLLITSAWWISLFPGLAILLTVLSFNLMGDWIRDRLDPKLRQVL